MTTPIGYYCSHTPGSGGLLGEIESVCGNGFENLSQSEKLWLLAHILADMTTESENYSVSDVRDDIVIVGQWVGGRLHELNLFDQIGLIQCLAENVKGGRGRS